MPLARQAVSVPLTAGLRQSEDIRALQTAGAAVMTNCVMQKGGSVRKRFGHTAISKSVASLYTMGAAVAGGSFRAAPWLAGSSSYVPLTALWNWVEDVGQWEPADYVSEAVALDRLSVMTLNNTFADVDQAYANGLLFVVYVADPGGRGYNVPFYTVIDPLTRTTVVASTMVDTTISAQCNAPKLTVVGTTVLLTYVRNAHIRGRTLSSTTPAAAWSAETQVDIDGINNISFGVYDVAPLGGSTTQFLLAYEVFSGGSQSVMFHVVTLAGFVLAISQTDDTVVTQLQSLAVGGSVGNYLWVAYTGQNSGGTKKVRAWAMLQSSPSTHVAPFDVYTFASDAPGRIGIQVASSTLASVYWSPFVNVSSSDGAMLAASYAATRMVSTSGATAGATAFTYGVMLASKPIALGSQAWLALATCSTSQGTTFLATDDQWNGAALTGNVNPQPLRAVATLDPRLAKFVTNLVPSGTLGQTATNLTALSSVGTGVIGLLGYSATSPLHSSLYEYPVDTQSTLRYSAAELYALEAISTGVPAVYDGQNISELGFLAYPEISQTSFVATGGAMQTSGLYQYIAVYEWIDAAGQIHRSATSPPVQVTASGSGNTGSCVVSVPTLNLTQRRQLGIGLGPGGSTPTPQKFPPYIALYRTQSNGTIFYRVTPDPATSANTVSFNASIVAFTDTLADASIATNALLYTTGGILDNYCPPSARIVVAHRNRWWLAGCPDPTALWPSKEVTPGELPGFNEAMNFTCTGAIRALASMDDKLIVFVQRGAAYGIEVITGEGPTDAGTQSDWSPPQRVPSAVGATDQRSVVTGSFGTLFRSVVGGPTGAGGIFLLSRDLQVSYLSGSVEDTLAANPVVTSAVLHPSQQRVYFTCVPTDVGFSSGVRLVWDYGVGGVWSVDQVADNDTSQASAGARTAWAGYSTTLGQVAYHWATAAGRVYRETLGGTGFAAYKDAGTFVPMTYTTALLKPSEGGFARFWGVSLELDTLETANPGSFTVTLTYDGAPASYYSEPWSWTGAQVATFDRFPQTDIRVVPGNQKAKAIQVSFTDTASGPIGQGFSVGGLVLELGVAEGSAYRNIPAAQRG